MDARSERGWKASEQRCLSRGLVQGTVRIHPDMPRCARVAFGFGLPSTTALNCRGVHPSTLPVDSGSRASAIVPNMKQPAGSAATSGATARVRTQVSAGA